MAILKKIEDGKATIANGQSRSIEESDPKFFSKYPGISEFLSLETWEDGSPRLRGTITLFFEEGLWKASLNDREYERSCFVTKHSLEALLTAIEVGIVKDSHDWRRWKQVTTKSKRKA